MLNDSHVVQLYRSGQTDAINLLIEKYKNKLYKLCYHLTLDKHDADDLFQDTWLKAVSKLDCYDTDKNFYSWLITIAVNLYRDRYRKAKRWLDKFKLVFSSENGDDEINDIESGEESSFDMVIREENKSEIIKSVNNLSDIYRLPIILYYYREFTYDDIANILEIPAGTVKSRLSTAKDKLRKAMEANNYGER